MPETTHICHDWPPALPEAGSRTEPEPESPSPDVPELPDRIDFQVDLISGRNSITIAITMNVSDIGRVIMGQKLPSDD